MADVVASAAAEKLVEYVIDPIVNQFKYLFCYATKIQNLSDALQDLEHKRTRVQHMVDESERNADVIEEDVKAWFENVDNKKKEAEGILNLNDPENSVMQCRCLKCPNLKFRYLQSRKATKLTTTIVELQKKGQFENVGYRIPPSELPNVVLSNVEGLKTRNSTKKEILEALKDEETFILGICGMPGVGKTTMVEEIKNDVKKFFDEVAFMVVSKDPIISKVQNHIAEALGSKIEEDNEKVRAGRLCHRLTCDVQKKILVILDDVWEEINLEKIGFPPKGARKGLKILLTSRFQNVCKKMGADRILEVKVLPDDESLKLLKDVAGISNDPSEVVIQVAKKCGGLPLALVLIGKGLIDANEYAWRDTLHQLENSTMGEEEVYKSIEISYNKLKHEGVKSLFLLCSLFPEDYNISIETLVRYARGLEMFKDTVTLSQTRDRVYSIVAHLKSCSLLLSCRDKEYEIKLHDVVRDFCLKIESEGKDGYMVKHNGVKEWPKHEKDDQLTVISLTFDDKLNELPSGLEYPNLKLLRVECQSEETKIPDDFFSKMNQLRVVDFISSSFNHIPSSIQSLMNLQTLCFDRCILTSRLSNIRSLKKLEILSFFGCNIVEFPIQIAHLSDLKSLDLRFKKYPNPFPRDVLSTLNELEELYLGDPFATSGDKCADFDQVEKEYIIGELSSLKGLHTFQICVKDRGFLLQMLKKMRPKKLKRFQIILSRGERDKVDYHFNKTLLLGHLEASAIKHPVICDSLLRGIENLSLRKVLGSLKNLVSELDKDGFVNLKTLILERCSFEYLIKLPFNRTSAFSKLEQLDLNDLSDLKGICDGNLPPGAFARLQKVVLEKLPCIEHLWRGVFKPPSLCNLWNFYLVRCDVIKSVFSESAAKCLLNLEHVVIIDCELLEHVVARDIAESEATDLVLEVKKLQSLRLWRLPNLKSFRNQSNVDSKALLNQIAFPNLKWLDAIGLHNIAKIVGDDIQPKALEKLRSVLVSSFDDLRTIAQSDSIKALQNLKDLRVHDCNALDVLFELEDLKVTEDETQSILSRLTYLSLTRLPKLVHIAKRVPKGLRVFQNLTSLHIDNCGSLKYLFTPSMASSLAGLETLLLRSCDAIEEIIGGEEEIEMVAFMGEFNKLEFPKLSTLRLEQLDNLRMFCCENIELVFPSLNQLTIDECPKMVKFSSQEPLAPTLKKLRIAGVNFTFEMSWIQDRFPNLEKLSVKEVQCVSKTLSDEIQPKFLEKLRSFDVWNFGDVMTIAQPDSIEALQNLDTLRVSRCSHIDVLFALEGLKVTKDETRSILSQLTSLELIDLPKLVHIARRVPKEICVFQNLTSLTVAKCGSLRYLFTLAMATSLSGLETLRLIGCEAIQEIIGREEEIEMAELAFIDKEGGELNKLVFPKLSTLKLLKLQSLRMFCSENIELEFPSLDQLAIATCPEMVKFSSQEPIAPKLKVIETGEDKYVDFSNVLDPGLFHVEDDKIWKLL